MDSCADLRRERRRKTKHCLGGTHMGKQKYTGLALAGDWGFSANPPIGSPNTTPYSIHLLSEARPARQQVTKAWKPSCLIMRYVLVP